MTEKKDTWQGLDTDLLEVIVRKLCYSDAVRFSAVCTSWLRAAKTSRVFSRPVLLKIANYQSHQSHYERLSLELHSPELSNTVVPLGERYRKSRVSKIVVPLGKRYRKSHCVGTSKGMVVIADTETETQIVLVNPFSGQSFYLPLLNRFYPLKAVILGDAANLVIVLLCVFPTMIVFFRAGSWAVLEMGQRYRDIVARERRLFVLLDSYSVDVWGFDQVNSDCPAKRNSFVPSEALPKMPAWPTNFNELYLVNSVREFFLVRKLVVSAIARNSSVKHRWWDFVEFEVYKSCLGSGERWEKVESLGDDVALFLGRNESVSVSSWDLPEGCEANSIYFTEDISVVTTKYSHEMGVYSFKHKKVNKRFYDGSNDDSGDPVPFWLVKSNLET